MKKILYLLAFLFYSLVYCQLENVKEMPFYAEKTDNGYRLFRISMKNDKNILIYLLKNNKITLDKIYKDDYVFEKDYAYLEEITASKEKQLLTAFIDEGNLYEVYNKKREIENYDNQSVEIYLVDKNDRKLVESFATFSEVLQSKFAKYILIN